MNDFVWSLRRSFQENAQKPCITDQEGARTLTYGDVRGMAERILGKLRGLGMKEGDPVLVRMDRRAEYVAAELAIMNGGGVVVPLLPEYPESRIEYISGDCGAKLTVDESFLGNLEQYAADSTVVERSEDAMRLIIYTSGSTGRPKGVVFRNKSLTLAYQPSPLVKTLPERHAAMSPMSFIASFSEIQIRLIRGLHIHLISEEMRKDILRLKAYIADQDIGSMFLPPTALRAFDLGDTNLKRVYTGGERVAHFKPTGFSLLNSYGQTETMGAVLYFTIDREYDNTPLGKPKAGVEVRLEDENGQEIIGEGEGELVATGYFASGYLNRPEENAKTFRALDDGRTEVRMGDIIRRLPDGNFVYVNRKDWMVKINGQRVDMGEVERVMQNVPGVQNAAVRDFDNVSGQKYLCGYYVTESLTEDQVRAGMALELPDYMMPSVLVRLPEIPLNTNGKTDRMALPEPKLLAQGEVVAPEGELETVLLDLVKKTLHLEDAENAVGVTTNLQQLGMTSISFISISAELHEKTGVDIPIAVFMKHPDIRGIVRGLDELPKAPPIPPHADPPSEFYGMTHDGEYVTMMAAMLPGKIAWHMPSALRIHNHTADEVAAVLRRVINAHSNLKAHVAVHNGRLMHQRRDWAEPVVHVFASDTEPDMKMLSGLMRPMDIFKDDLYTAEVIAAPSGDVYVLFDVHHILYDGYSQGLVLDEIRQGLNGVEIPDEDYTFCDFIEYMDMLEKSDYTQTMRPWFDEYLKGHIPAYYPTDMAPNGDNRMLNASSTVDARAVEEYCKRRGIRMPVLYQSAVAQVLSRFTMTEKKIFNMVYSDRDAAQVVRSVGLVAKSLLMRYPTSDGTLLDELRTAQQIYQDANDRSRFSSRILHDEYGIEISFILDYLIGIVDGADEKVAQDVENLSSGFTSDSLVPFTMLCVMSHPVDPTKHLINMVYSAGFYSEAAMKRLTDAVAAYVNACVEDDSQKAKSVSLTRGKEQELLDSGRGFTFDPEHKSVVQTGDPQDHVLICDAYGNLQPMGELGELYVAGPGLDKLAGETISGVVPMKRTGYMGQYLHGEFVTYGPVEKVMYLNRTYVDLSIPEKLLAEQPGVEHSAILLKTLNDNVRICGYYQGSMDRAEGKARLNALLPKVSRFYSLTRVEDWPEDPEKLPAPDLSVPYEAPAGELERTLCSGIAAFLGKEQVGANDRLFDLDIGAIRMFALQQSLAERGLDVPYSLLFAAQTPRAIAARLQNTR